jgi:hypothetical protein
MGRMEERERGIVAEARPCSLLRRTGKRPPYLRENASGRTKTLTIPPDRVNKAHYYVMGRRDTYPTTFLNGPQVNSAESL